jgi:murein DD-endopeptidase MepM/ murein hydrolase activator NlpD
MRFNEFKLVEANSKDTIKRVQQILKDLGYDLGPTGVDGIVGPYTQSAIDAYMSKKGPEGQNAPVKVKPKTDVPTTSNASSGKPINTKLGSPYGPRRDGFHYGADFPAPTGTPVYAPDDGVVWSAGLAGSAGLMVAINSGNTQHKLMHLSAVKVKPGEKVSKGQLVGLSGNTGHSTGPHLHWSKIVAGSPVNPMSNIG